MLVGTCNLRLEAPGQLILPQGQRYVSAGLPGTAFFYFMIIRLLCCIFIVPPG